MRGPARLGIVVALPEEARPLLRIYTDALQPPLGCEGIMLEMTGIGAQQASSGAQRLIQLGATALLSWGTAAGLQPELQPGTVVLPQIVIDTDGREFHVDAEWHQRILCRLAGWMEPVIGPLAASPGLLRRPYDKQVLYSRTGALSADMESAAIACAAQEAAIPFLTVRAVADPAAAVMPDCVIRSVDPQGRIHVTKLLALAAIRPGDWAHLVLLARWFAGARRALTHVARRTKPMVLASNPP